MRASWKAALSAAARPPTFVPTHDVLIGDPMASLYCGKLVEEPDGRPVFLAWRNFTPDDTFVGAVDGEGNFSVERAQAHLSVAVSSTASSRAWATSPQRARHMGGVEIYPG